MYKIILILLISSTLLAQNLTERVYFVADTSNQNSNNNILASPEIGWKTFCDRIEYPANEREKNIETSFNIHFVIDSVGNAEEIKCYGEIDSSVFFKSVQSVIKSTKWQPAISDGIKRISVYIPIIFYIKRYENPFPLVFETTSILYHNSIRYGKDLDRYYNTEDSITTKDDSIYFIGTNSKICDEFTSPIPAAGFDSIKSISIDPIVKRAGINASKIIKLFFNKLGRIDSLYYSPYMEIVVYQIASELQKMDWIVGKNKSLPSYLSVPIVHYISDRMNVCPIIVELQKCDAN